MKEDSKNIGLSVADIGAEGDIEALVRTSNFADPGTVAFSNSGSVVL